MGTKFINNREGNTLLGEFERTFKGAVFSNLDILVAYFYASGYKHLYPLLEGVKKIRIIVGINADARIKKHHAQGVLALEEQDEGVRQEVLAHFKKDIEAAPYDRETENGMKQFLMDVARKKICLRIYPKQNLHAKFYVYRSEGDARKNRDGVIMGSSNLTGSGLGGKQALSNYELNAHFKDQDDVKFAVDEFEDLWKDSITFEVNPEMPGTLFAPISPYHLYIKFLMEYFGPDFHHDRSGDWKGLKKYKYQVDAVNEAVQKLEKHDGIFLADVVGLGKTVIASAIAQSFYHQRARSGILVICPAALKNHWANTMRKFLPRRGIVEYETPGRLNNISDEDAKCYDLIIVDESHRFRNKETSQYERLQEICKIPLNSDKKRKVVLISATPINNDPEDLYNQIHLFLDGSDCSLTGIPLSLYFKKVIRKYKKIKKTFPDDDAKARKQIEDLYSKVRPQVIEKITIRRTRADLTDNARYADDLDKRGVKFPVFELNEIPYELSSELGSLYDKTIKILSGQKKNEKLSYMRYQVLAHRSNALAEQQMAGARANQLVHIMKVLLLKRMDSSFHAFQQTLKAFIKSSESMLKMIKDGKVYVVKDVRVQDYVFEKGLDGLLQELVQGNKQGEVIKSEDLTEEFKSGVKKDHEILIKLAEEWRCVAGDADPKLDTFLCRLPDLLSRDNQEGKLVIFTESADTMKYLAKALRKSGYRPLEIDASQANAKKLSEIEANFDANIPEAKKKNDHHLLVTTDVLAEGINLHRANAVVNYDTPWNVVKLMQRMGRVDRIGTKAEKIIANNFFPTDKINKDLKFKQRALVKAMSFQRAFGLDNPIYSEEEEVSSLSLYKARIDEVQNREFTFREELRNFKNENQAEYERIKEMGSKLRNGVINKQKSQQTFIFLRTSNRDTSSFYLIGPGKGDIKMYDFVESAELLKCEKDRQYVKPHARHHQQVKIATDKFLQEREQERYISKRPSLDQLSPRIKKAYKDLKTIRDNAEDGSENRKLFDQALKAVMRESHYKFNKEIGEYFSKLGKQSFSPEKISEIAEYIRKALPAEGPQKVTRATEVSPTVVISQSYTG